MATRHTERDRQERRQETERDGRSRDPVLIRGVQLVLGTVLLGYGHRQRSRLGTATAFGGAVLVGRALVGPSRLRRALPGRESAESEQPTRDQPATDVRRSITVGESPEELYERWRDPETFAQVMGHVADVTESGEDRFRWTVHGPYGQDISWETEIVDAEPGERLRWETPTDAVLPNEGAIRFREAAGDRGTTVTLSVSFDPPGGTLGTAALDQFDIAPATLASVALDRFKSLVETGEIPTLDGNSSARGSGDTV